ncbi:MAG TPA: helix-turn-helix domain-containing protein [Candidatus Limnocylindrales bacterium]
MTRLADLRAEVFPAAKPLGGERRAEDGPPVAWVRVMKARVPAFDALEPGDLAVVPASALAVVAPTPDDLGPLVAAFRSTRVSGVLLVEGDSLAPAAGTRLDELQSAVEAAGLAGLRLAPADPAAIERTVIGFIVGRAGELERQAGLLEADLERRALAGEGTAAIVAAAAEFLARALALEAPHGEVLTVHAPVAALDAAPAVAAYAAGRRDSAVLRVPLPAGGAIALLGPRVPTDLERLSLGRAATLLALELAREEAVRRASDSGGREALPSGGPPWVVVLAQQRGLAEGEDTPGKRATREQLRRELRLLAPARRLGLRGDLDSLEYRLVLAAPDGADLELPARISSVLRRTVAVSRPFRTAADRPTAEAEARATLDAALALPDSPAVARADRLAAYRLMGALHNLPDGSRLAAAILAPILVGRPDVRRERLETLRAVLAHGGVNEAALALGVHRNTIAYRLRRIEALAGWRLADPEVRLPLSIAARIVQEEQI